jgi:hypothetical protein
MDFAFKEIATLPKLAWALRVQRGAARVLVEHGSWVEVRERFFCEGAWNGDFAAQSIESSILMGSAGMKKNGCCRRNRRGNPKYAVSKVLRRLLAIL